MTKYNKYDMSLYIDAINNFIRANATFNYVCKEDAIKELFLYIHKDITMESIVCDELASYEVGKELAEWSPFIAESKRITIRFNKPLLKGEKVDIKFNYNGYINKVGEAGINRITNDWIELGIYSAWFPLTEGFEKAWFNVKISLEDDDSILVGSTNTKRCNEGWIIQQKSPFLDCTFLASKSFKINHFSGKANDTEVDVYYIDKKHQKIAKRLRDDALNVLGSFTKKFGDINQENFSIVIVPRDNSQSGGGYNRPGLIVLPDLDDNQPITHYKYLTGEMGNFKYLAHELAHLWWSKADVTTWEDWLNESFAEYSCLIAIRDYYGKEEFTGIVNKYILESKSLPQIIGLDRGDDDAFEVLYIKGPALLYELEREIGEENFSLLLKEIHSNKIHKTQQLFDVLAKFASEKTVENFKQKLS